MLTVYIDQLQAVNISLGIGFKTIDRIYESLRSDNDTIAQEIIMPLKIAVYPGSFDPITNGHVDIIKRSLRVFDRVIVAVARNSSKISLFSVNERVELIKKVMADDSRTIVDTFDGLLVNYVKSKNASVIIRGLRAVSDFEYEFQSAQVNRGLDNNIETLFMMTSVPYVYLSSSVVKEISSLNGNIDQLVPEAVAQALMNKYDKSLNRR